MFPVGMANSSKLGTTPQYRSNIENHTKIAITTPSAPGKNKVFQINSKHHTSTHFFYIYCHFLIWQTTICFRLVFFQDGYLPLCTHENMHLELFGGFFAILFSQNGIEINSNCNRVWWTRKVWNNCREHFFQEGF